MNNQIEQEYVFVPVQQENPSEDGWYHVAYLLDGPHTHKRYVLYFNDGKWLNYHQLDFSHWLKPKTEAAAGEESEGEAWEAKKVCYCGSLRVAVEAFKKMEYESVLKGEIALLPCNIHVERNYTQDSDYKKKANELHKRKIDIADEVFILNVGGYIGESTRNEINYALSIGKPVKYLEGVNDVASDSKASPSLASHSCTEGGSIEQLKKLIELEIKSLESLGRYSHTMSAKSATYAYKKVLQFIEQDKNHNESR